AVSAVLPGSEADRGSTRAAEAPGVFFVDAIENLQLIPRPKENATVATAFLWQLKLKVQTVVAESLLRAKKLFASLAIEFEGNLHRLVIDQLPLNLPLIIVRVDPLPGERLPGVKVCAVEQHHRTVRRIQSDGRR
ncbi:hypothetical protein, partial [Stieleria mannarensis]|uniref:hypothetical protein n=1 Tax=Stieleria mannarensis TaxID=2755585 RepID=UPI003F519BEA